MLSALVVSFNQRELTLSCIHSLLGAFGTLHVKCELVVLDNGSTDGSCDAIRALDAPVTLVELHSNIGFAGAIAEGVRRTEGEWILLLNNDATIEAEAVAEMLAAGDSDSTIGAVAPTVLFADGSDRINSAGLEVDRLGVARDRLLGSTRNAAAHSHVTPVFGASGVAALLRRAMVEDAGGIDESLFMYLEDVDLAWRARARDWKAIHVGSAVVHHHHSRSAGHGSDFKYFHVGRNRVRVLAKNASRRQLALYGPAIVAYEIGYVAFVAITERTLAPLRGRLAGLSEWRSYRGDGGPRLALAELAPAFGLRAALGRRRVWAARSSTGRRRGPTARS